MQTHCLYAYCTGGVVRAPGNAASSTINSVGNPDLHFMVCIKEDQHALSVELIGTWFLNRRDWRRPRVKVASISRTVGWSRGSPMIC